MGTAFLEGMWVGRGLTWEAGGEDFPHLTPLKPLGPPLPRGSHPVLGSLN